MKRRKIKIFFIAFALITMLLRLFLINQPAIVENYYSKGLFTLIRVIFDSTFYYSVFPMIFVFLIIALSYLFLIFYRMFRGDMPLKKRFVQFFISISAFISLLYMSFMWLWGFNYLRIPIEQTLQFSADPIQTASLKEKLMSRLPDLVEARNSIPNSTEAPLDLTYLPDNFEEQIRNQVKEALRKYAYPAKTDVQGRLLPKGTLLKIKTAGIYFPFVGESNIDAGLHPLQYSETLAHEFAHAYGFGDEGTCSFIAYFSLLDAEDPFIRYSLLLSYWRTLARNYLQFNNEDYQAYRLTLPREIVADLDAIAENRKLYRSLFPNSRNKIYDSYLKAQGIEEGLQNYNRVIMLVEGFEAKNSLQ